MVVVGTRFVYFVSEHDRRTRPVVIRIVDVGLHYKVYQVSERLYYIKILLLKVLQQGLSIQNDTLIEIINVFIHVYSYTECDLPKNETFFTFDP